MSWRPCWTTHGPLPLKGQSPTDRKKSLKRIPRSNKMDLILMHLHKDCLDQFRSRLACLSVKSVLFYSQGLGDAEKTSLQYSTSYSVYVNSLFRRPISWIIHTHLHFVWIWFLDKKVWYVNLLRKYLTVTGIFIIHFIYMTAKYFDTDVQNAST